MRKVLSLIVIILIASPIAHATDLDKLCNDSKKIISKINSQRTNIGKIRTECKNVISLKLRIKKIIGLNNLETRKAIPSKTLKSVIKLVQAENIKIGRVARTYRSINKNSINLKKNIFLLDREINKLTEKWERQNLLKYKKNCLLLLYSQVQKLERDVKEIRLTSFSFGNTNSLDLSKFISSKTGDPGSKSSIAAVKAANWEKEASSIDSAIEEAKKASEEAKEQLQLAIKVLKEVAERQTQNIQAITGM